ncbi:M23 family metallopeptidase [Candidatus Parcubacteria bacterium]|nr:MAG: M23 family metallopeptidase [Candidatus Parcubacteria bacterium]
MGVFLFILKTLAWLTITIKALIRGSASLARRFFLRHLFRIVAQFYCHYQLFLRKIGWTRLRGTVVGYLVGKKLIHITVITLTIIMLITNVSQTKAVNLNEQARHTILSQIVKTELDVGEEEEYEEIFSLSATDLQTNRHYFDYNTALILNNHLFTLGQQEETVTNEDLAMLQTKDALIKPKVISTTKTKRPRTKIIYHTVAPGETVSSIAYQYDLSVNTILWENNLSAWSVIHPGDKLTILPFDGVTHKVKKGETLSSIAKKYKVEEKEILEANHLTNASYLQVGAKLLIPGGKKDQRPSNPIRRSYSGYSAVKRIISEEPRGSGNKMLWPTPGRRITQYYSWRHRALDIADKVGTPLSAADAGVVEKAGWSRGYGLNVVINHGGGKKTRYAHMSKLKVKKGQKVRRGELIGLMGSTGWSTGPHVHFEVIINGKKYNPLNYLK